MCGSLFFLFLSFLLSSLSPYFSLSSSNFMFLSLFSLSLHPLCIPAGQESCSATAAAAAAAAAASAVQREERSKVLRERQNEERQRKLEELKQQVNKRLLFKWVFFFLLYYYSFICAAAALGRFRPGPSYLATQLCCVLCVCSVIIIHWFGFLLVKMVIGVGDAKIS
jgi:hypothetical protein